MADITPNTANPVREDAYVTELATKLGIDAKYIPKSPTWRNEEEIKVLADLFANMSAGGGGGLLVTLTYGEGLYVCDKTAKEMWDAAQNGVFMFKFTYAGDTMLYSLKDASKDSSGYTFTMSTGEYLEADSDSDYPSGTAS